MASLRPARCLNATILRPRTATVPQRCLGAASVRYKSSAYGYTQAKTLVYSQAGEPTDVLKYVFAFFFSAYSSSPCPN